MTDLRLWQIEIQSDKMGRSPAKASYYAKRHMVNVAAPDIHSAIEGGLQELRDRYGEELNEESLWVISANHKGAVNRIVE